MTNQRFIRARDRNGFILFVNPAAVAVAEQLHDDSYSLRDATGGPLGTADADEAWVLMHATVPNATPTTLVGVWEDGEGYGWRTLPVLAWSVVPLDSGYHSEPVTLAEPADGRWFHDLSGTTGPGRFLFPDDSAFDTMEQAAGHALARRFAEAA